MVAEILIIISTWCPVQEHIHTKGFRTGPWRYEKRQWVRYRQCKTKKCHHYLARQIQYKDR